jgi:N-acetylglucosamine kinase-like BadF-type ATPase
MPRCFLGVDVGGTKTQALVAGEDGRCLGLGEGGPGNPEEVGYAGLAAVLGEAVGAALAAAGLAIGDIAGAGFGVAGLDWPCEEEPIRQAIRSLGLYAPFAQVNDTIVGLLAGSPEGWGVAVVSGTGCNCWGWDRTRQRVGRVTGHGVWAGEGAGASELMQRALQSVAYEWTRRGLPTALTPAFLRYTGIATLGELMEKVFTRQVELGPAAAPLVFQAAAAGDPVAGEVIHWAGCELGELANAVIRQLEFQAEEFDVVLVGSMYEGGALLVEPLRQAVWGLAPRARLVRLTAPPVVGAVVLGMEQVGAAAPAKREALIRSCCHGR